MLLGPQRVGGHGRLVLVVLAPVDEHLARAPVLAHVGDDELGMAALQQLRDRLREALGLLVGGRHVERHVDLHPLRARGLREPLQPEVPEHLAQVQRHARALDDRGRRAGIEIEGEDRRRARIGRLRQRGVQLQVGEVGQPDQRRQVVGEHEVDRAPVGADRDRGRPDPVRPVAGRVLLVEELRVDAVRIALERERTPLEVREHEGRDPRVVVDHVALGERGLGIQDLVEVGEREPAAEHLDLDPLRLRHPLERTR